jgi:hypothetical protein
MHHICTYLLLRDGPLEKWVGGGAKPKKKFIPRKKLGEKNLPRHSAKKNSLEDRPVNCT